LCRIIRIHIARLRLDWINLVRLINYEKLSLEKKGSGQQLRMGNF
jgi:hypothetical protein